MKSNMAKTGNAELVRPKRNSQPTRYLVTVQAPTSGIQPRTSNSPDGEVAFTVCKRVEYSYNAQTDEWLITVTDEDIIVGNTTFDVVANSGKRYADVMWHEAGWYKVITEDCSDS